MSDETPIRYADGTRIPQDIKNEAIQLLEQHLTNCNDEPFYSCVENTVFTVLERRSRELVGITQGKRQRSRFVVDNDDMHKAFIWT